MIYYHYVISVYHPDTHQVIGRNSGIQRVRNGMDPVESHSALVSQYGERLPTVPGVVEGAYFIINPYNLLAVDDTQAAEVGAPAPIDPLQAEAMREWKALHGNGEPQPGAIKASIHDAKPGDFFHHDDGSVLYMARNEPELIPVDAQPGLVPDSHEHVGGAGKTVAVPDRDSEEMRQCDGCWHEDTISGWLENDGECPACNTEHDDLRSPS